ncbi:hypothetical protein VNO77_20409 [Canavalia gladiata]|uniref:Protein MIZU-KUSSEI 1-like n=1 Tax=Canavalia gladiata TaxID=3824 RepID=A0AAN9LUC1_CANGL
MTIDTLRRFFLPCFFPSKPQPIPFSNNPTTTTKKRPSTTTTTTTRPSSPSSSTSSTATTTSAAPPRPSKSMVIGTIFGNRRGHVWFCVQHDRLSPKPSLLLELPLSTNHLVREMRNGLVRIALECSPTRPDLASCPLRSVPLWTAFCNGKKTGFAARRRAGDSVRSILRTMQCVSVGAGVIPSGFGSGSEELMYMRANFEHVVGNADSESFHLINPDECPGQELSVFLLRSRLGALR